MDLRGFQELNGKQVHLFWGIDIAALVECKLKHRGVVNFFAYRDAILSGKTPGEAAAALAGVK